MKPELVCTFSRSRYIESGKRQIALGFLGEGVRLQHCLCHHLCDHSAGETWKWIEEYGFLKMCCLLIQHFLPTSLIMRAQWEQLLLKVRQTDDESAYEKFKGTAFVYMWFKQHYNPQFYLHLTQKNTNQFLVHFIHTLITTYLLSKYCCRYLQHNTFFTDTVITQNTLDFILLKCYYHKCHI